MSSKYDISGTLHHSFQIGDGPTLFYGSSVPTSDIGNVGDIYFLSETSSISSSETLGSLYIKENKNNIISWQKIASTTEAQTDLSNYVSVINQSFTEAQKEQARKNIGAGDLNKPSIESTSESDISIVVEPNTIYNCSALTNLIVDASNITSVNDISKIYFTSSENMTFGFSSVLKFSGTDVSDNVFTPVANKRYYLMIFNDGIFTQIIVHGVLI